MYDLTNQVFNRLKVLNRDLSRTGAGKQCYWYCLCSCGNTTIVDSWSLRKNRTKSCGCLQEENRYTRNLTNITKHGMYNTRTYHTWEGMKQRCSNPAYPNYKYYGALGISVCPEWMNFKQFLKDMGERPKGKSLDRIDPFGNYEPSNCRWATPTEQANNKRSSRRSLPTLC